MTSDKHKILLSFSSEDYEKIIKMFQLDETADRVYLIDAVHEHIEKLINIIADEKATVIKNTTENSSLFSEIVKRFKAESSTKFLQLNENTLVEQRVFMTRLFKELIKTDVDLYADSQFCKNDLEKLLSAIILQISYTVHEMIELNEQKTIDLIIDLFTREL